MSAARDLARRRWWAIAALAPVVAALVPLVLAAPGSSGVVVQPVLGAADAEVHLMGASESGGEVWGYRKLPLRVAPPVVDGQPLRFGPGAEDGQLAFLRYTPATGWRYEQTPLDEAGNPSRGPIANPQSARVTAAGGGLLVGRDRFRPADNQVIVLARDPGGRFRAIPSPGREIVEAGEALAAEDGEGSLAVAAFDRADKTAAFFAAGGPSVERAIAFWDGEAWHREPIEVPLDGEAGMKVLGISATDPGNAWLVARKAASAGRGVSLFERTTDGGPRWRERSLGASPFAQHVDADIGLEEVEALGDGAQSITATTDGVWLDGRFRATAESGELHTFTLYFDRAAGRVTGSWCDAVNTSDGGAVCDHRLDARLSTQTGVGYRSFAWPGEGFGTRIVTNPLEPGGDGETNRGTYLRFEGTTFERMPGGGGNFRPGGAFSSVDEGWLEGPFHITRSPEPVHMRDSWPVSARGPLTSVAPAPGSTPGDGGAQALAAGTDGSVLRYKPGEGWTREFLLSSTGAVVRSNLRGVAWPESSRAHAVGDLGAMWLWRSETGLWERDPGAPVGYEAHLMDVAFAPGSAERGYAVGKAGALLSYGKSWTQDAVPDGYGSADFTQIAFAGGQALVATSRVARDADVLVNDGSGWRVDEGAHALLRSLPGRQQLHAVAGLPDGGAVAAGRDVVLIRDSAGSPWRFSDQPLPGSMVIAAAATRDGGRVRPIVSVVRALDETSWRYPPVDDVGVVDPNQPLPLLSAYPLPADGFVLRETATAWRDEQHSAFAGSGDDRPLKSDPVLDFAVGPGGSGWAVGGWSGEQDAAYSGSSGRGAGSKADRARVQTAAVFRLGEQTAAAPGAAAAPVELPTGPARVAVGGHAACEAPCADLALQEIRPDRSLVAALGKVAALRAQPAGPRMMLYTGGRLAPHVDPRVAPREMGQYAALMASQPVPVYPAVSATDVPAAGSFRTAFGSFYAPFGAGAPPPGVDVSRIPGAPPGPGARTHYAFDSAGPEGTLRVIVIDNAAGSLAASNAHQNPIEDQAAWLAGTLLDAKTRGIPAIVMGSRDLNARFTPRLNTADDGDAVARILIDGGASAYFFERPEENRAYQLNGGGLGSIPAYGTGTLGYRSTLNDPSNPSKPNALFGDSGFLLAEVDIAHRDPLTNKAPVNVRMIPLIDDLSIQATDGTLIRRSRPALFQGLGRRPLGGDRWRPLSTGSSDPAGSDPYISFPPDQCLIAGCSTRIDPEYQFHSSDPDIGDFVRQDPNSTNLRKPYLGADDKPVSDARSGLFCAFNAGTTTVSVRAGGLSFAQQVRILPGTVQRPCGTRPLRPDRFRRVSAAAPAAPPPATPQGGNEPPVTFNAPPPPAAPAPTPTPSPPVTPFVPAFLPPLDPAGYLPPVPLPVAPALLRPSPPSGGFGRAFEKQREEEVAPEEMQAFTRYHAEDQGLPAGYLLGALVLAALAGSSIFGGPRGRPRPRAAPAYATRPRRHGR